MNFNIDFNNILKKAIPFGIMILIAITLNTILFVFLPKSNFTENLKQNTIMEYKKYKFKESFGEKKALKNKIIKQKMKKEYTLISNIVLKMIYQEEDNTGWIVISEKSSTDSIILGVGEFYKRYKLQYINRNYVVFLKGNKEYKLQLNLEEEILSPIKKVKDNYKDKIEKVEDQYYIKRDLITEYTQNDSKIWKDISIKETMKNGVIDGFRIMGLVNDSVFSKLGLRQGDIIKSVNNIKLTSYADAFNLYKKINKVKNLKFTIMRRNEKVELEYEIK